MIQQRLLCVGLITMSRVASTGSQCEGALRGETPHQRAVRNIQAAIYDTDRSLALSGRAVDFPVTGIFTICPPEASAM